jgi:hypothetical protein
MSVLVLPSSPKEEKAEGSSLNFGETGMRQSSAGVVER